MGLFKQMKGAKQALEAAPDMVKQTQEMQANAEQMAAAQQQAAAQQAAAAQQSQAATAGAGELEPIAGVSLAQFAEVCRELQNHNYDQSKAPGIAAEKGISAEDWQAAMDGWNERIKAEPAVAQQFNGFYRAG